MDETDNYVSAGALSQSFVKRYADVIEGEESADAAARRAIEKLAAGGSGGR